MNDGIKICRYNDDISFRQCDLSKNDGNLNYGNCTAFYTKEENWKTHYYCSQYGIHLHCSKHPEIELNKIGNCNRGCFLKCPKCNNKIEIEDYNQLLQSCLKLLNIKKFKGADLIRLDDWYTPEIKQKIKLDSDYWMKVDIKTDKDRDTMIVLYIGKKNDNEKVQFFIKPEKLQLSHDYKDLDPKSILSKIEVTLKDRIIKQEYDK